MNAVASAPAGVLDVALRRQQHVGLGLGEREAFDVALDGLARDGGFIDVGILAALAGAKGEDIEIDPDLAQQVAAAWASGGEVDAGRGVHGWKSAGRCTGRRMRTGACGGDLPQILMGFARGHATVSMARARLRVAATYSR